MGSEPIRISLKKGASVTLYTAPPEGSVVVDIDEMGPESAKSFPGRQIVRESAEGPAVRAKQEIDYGRRGKGSIFGAFKPADGEVLTHPYPSRSAVNFADFLERVDAWISPDIERIYAIMDNLSAHRATDILLFSLAHPRWEFLAFSPNTRRTSIFLKLGGRSCALWRSKAAALKPGRSSAVRSKKPRPIGMLTVTPLSGVAVVAIVSDVPASLNYPMWPELAGCTT